MELSNENLRVLLYEEFKTNRISHHIDSVNTFYKTGIPQIMTSTFAIGVAVENKRTATPADLAIDKIVVNLEITNVTLDKPIVAGRSGREEILTPKEARQSNLTYSSPLKIDVIVTATAYNKNGTTTVKVDDSVKNLKISGIPTMIRSMLCHTYNMTEQQLINIQEDPTDPGGYFIIKGVEWVIDNLENIKYNEFHVHKNIGYQNESTRGELISKPGDAFENSAEIIITMLTDGRLVCRIISQKMTINGLEIEFPFYVIFRLLGITNDKEMIEHVVYSMDSKISKDMQDKLELALNVKYPQLEHIRWKYSSAEILMFLGQSMDCYGMYYDTNKELKGDAQTKENTQKYIFNNILSMFDKYFLPHVGLTKELRYNKLRFFGHLIHKLLMVNMGLIEGTDRDSYANKRVHPAGVSFSKAFKTQFNFAVVQAIRRELNREIKRASFENINWGQVVTSAIHGNDFEKVLTSAISASDMQIKINSRLFSNHLSAQQLHRKNPLNVISTLRQVISPNIRTSQSKSSNRAIEMRQVHPSYVGYICIIQSADTGEKVGMQKQMSISASITASGVSAILKEKIYTETSFTHLEFVPPSALSNCAISKIFVNGEWLGVVSKPYELVIKYRNMRRKGLIHRFTTIYWNIISNEIMFWVDVGRIVRPLLIVYSNLDPHPEDMGKRTTTFEQYIKLTPQLLLKLYTNEITMENLMEMGVIEYINPEEQQSCLLALSYDHLMENKNNILKQYTHCEIPQSVVGLAALTAPCSPHNQLARVCYQTNQVKQTCSWYALNWKYRSEKETFIQYYCEHPNIRTMANKCINPAGANVTIAYMIYGGYNQEDSLLLNKSAIKRGLFVGSYFSFEVTELDKGEEFGNPNRTDTSDIKSNVNYEKLTNGMIKQGEIIYHNDAIIGKKLKVQLDDNNGMPYVDKSVIYKGHEMAIVENVVFTRNQVGDQMCKVVYRVIRPPEVGNKFSSRAGQKGVCGMVYEQMDMPFTKNGIVPDIIMNPHGIPSRMTIGQTIETLASKLCAINGTSSDATLFGKVDIVAIGKEMSKYGYSDNGEETLYDGKTGEAIKVRIYIGAAYYQCLQKFVKNSMYAVKQGPVCALTRQPLSGKASGGGLRIGEMERDVLAGNGALAFLSEKFTIDSDHFDVYMCGRCGIKNNVIVNESKKKYICKKCKDLADIYKLPSTWSSNIFFQEMRALNIGTKFIKEPPIFEKYL